MSGASVTCQKDEKKLLKKYFNTLPSIFNQQFRLSTNNFYVTLSTIYLIIRIFDVKGQQYAKVCSVEKHKFKIDTVFFNIHWF